MRSKRLEKYFGVKEIYLPDGNLSLHVDFGNDRATNLYEKFGFKKSYIRMIYHEEEI